MLKKLRTLIIRLLTKLSKKKEIYYIGGAELLPAPLSADDEAELISNLGSDPSASAKLIEHNLRLVVYIAKRFENTGIGIEDLTSIGTIGLIKAINSYQPDKNIKLATYASRCIENEILMYIRKNNGRRREISIDEPLNTDWDGNVLLLSDVLGTDEDGIYKIYEENEEREMVFKAIEKLSEREKLIVRMRFGLHGEEEKTQKEVADLLGISQSYISRLEKKIIKRLRKELEAKI